MNRQILYIIAAVMLLSAIATSCKKGKEDIPWMTIVQTEYYNWILFRLAGSGTAMIDWGDGTIETYTLSAYNVSDWENGYLENARQKYNFKYIYPDRYFTTITITGEDITHLDFYDYPNDIKNLDVSNNPNLTYLNCGYKGLTSLDVSKNTKLEYLNCSNTDQYQKFIYMTELNVSKNTKLKVLSCSSHQITSLDVSKNTVLEKLDCNNNHITSLDVNNNTVLNELKCHYNKITSLDVNNNIMLKELNCFNNQLESINVSNNTLLTFLDCGKNQIADLDVSNNILLINLSCSYNIMSFNSLNDLFETLHNYPGFKMIHIGYNQGTESCDQSIAQDKGWNVLTYAYDYY